MNEEELFSCVEIASKVSPPLSPRTLAYREKVLQESRELGILEFPRGCSLDYISQFSNHKLKMTKLGSWVDLKNGYRLRIPAADDRMWVMTEFGMHGVPLIMFEYGLRLPMHLFHLAMYDAIGCGIAQLSPNSVAQISGFIALCNERDRISSGKLFFSIYSIRYHNGQVYFDTQIAGESLKWLLESGFSVKMDKAMMMLVKKSKAGVVDMPRVDENTSSRTISIELLDDRGNKVVGGSEPVACEGTGNPSRKRLRSGAVETSEVAGKKVCEDAAGSGVNKTITIIGNRDSSAYAKRSRSKLVDRCLGRAGRYLSDVMHILEEYKADEGKSSPSKVEEERDLLKGEKKKLENELGEAKGRIVELSKANSSYRTKVVVNFLEASVGEEIKRREALEAEVAALREKNEALETDNLNLKLEVDKGVEEIAGALGDGYGRCVERMEAAGFDLSGHGFADYLRDYAEQHKENEDANKPIDP
ncbi:hypothetical protein AgCh_038503 [Apium graveolens]